MRWWCGMGVVCGLCVLMIALVACGGSAASSANPAANPVPNDAPAPASGNGNGAALFEQLGCVACHHMNGSGPGPSLAGLYGTTITLENGDEVTADEQYIRTAILDPKAQILAGYLPIMPDYASRVSDEDLAALVEYIRTLPE